MDGYRIVMIQNISDYFSRRSVLEVQFLFLYLRTVLVQTGIEKIILEISPE